MRFAITARHGIRSKRTLCDARAGRSLPLRYISTSVTDKLVEEGVKLFADEADKLLGVVAQKRTKILGDQLDTQALALGEALSKDVDTAADEWRSHGNIRKLWQRAQIA